MTKYKILAVPGTAKIDEDLGTLVNGFLSKGWTLAGGLCITPRENVIQPGGLFQAVTTTIPEP
jgi:hypothetical protein